ncbi:MAG: DUF6683 family protein [Capsulimonadales bacterium]|nr:DUF6683 family protein [Capsulimonadales bacterium]
MRRSFVLLAPVAPVLCSVGICAAHAQPPGAENLANLLKRLPSSGTIAPAPAENAPTRFKPSGQRPLLDKLVGEMQGTDAEKKTLRDGIETFLKAYETEATRLKMENDIAGAAVFYVVANYQIHRGIDDTSDKATVSLYRQFASVMNTDDVRKMTDAEKQTTYDALTLLASIALIRYQGATTSKNADELKSLREQGGTALKDLLKTDPDRLRITDAGLSVTGETTKAGDGESASAASPDKTETTGAGALRIEAPPGWQRAEVKDSGTVGYARKLEKGILLMMYSPTPIKAQGGREQTFRASWESATKGMLTDTSMPVIGRRILGNTVALFYHAKVNRTNNVCTDQLTLYLLEAGDAYYSLIVRYMPEDTTRLGSSLEDVGSAFGYRKDESYPATEEFLKGIRVNAPTPPKPAYMIAEIQGEWQRTSISSAANYVNSAGAYVGDASTGSGDELTLRPDGTFRQMVSLLINGRSGFGYTFEGKYHINGDALVMKGTRTPYNKPGVPESKILRILAAGKDKDGDRRLILADPQMPIDFGSVVNTHGYKAR